MDELTIETVPGSQPGVRVLRLSGPFVLQGVFEFQSAVRAINDPVLILDLSAVPFMDSAALGAVMGLHASSQRQHRKYALAGASERLCTLFDVAGVAKILVTYPTVEEAQEKLAASPGIAKPAP
jgi:anti-sigma B factor antagonist